MTEKERSYIQALAEQYEAWSQEEQKKARRSDDPEEKVLHIKKVIKFTSKVLVLQQVLGHLDQNDYTL